MNPLRMIFSTELGDGFKKKDPSLLYLVKNEPEKFKLEAYIEDEEIIVKIKRRNNAQNSRS